MSDVIPVVLFAYARPVHLARVLACLRENQVLLIYAYADAAKGTRDTGQVEEVRALLRKIDWAEVRLIEREKNLGLGANVLAGITDVAGRHDAFVVWEDDLICVPGTYAWVCAVLRHYANDERAMSVTAWNHPRIIPADAGSSPYFDGRAECWVWGTWARSWRGMVAETALEKMALGRRRGISPNTYGADLPEMARVELRKNIWAVRWIYHHLACGGLCLRPPWSMVEHIGFDAQATNTRTVVTEWSNPPLREAPAIPMVWPDVIENNGCRQLWRAANPPEGFFKKWQRRLVARWQRIFG